MNGGQVSDASILTNQSIVKFGPLDVLILDSTALHFPEFQENIEVAEQEVCQVHTSLSGYSFKPDGNEIVDEFPNQVSEFEMIWGIIEYQI